MEVMVPPPPPPPAAEFHLDSASTSPYVSAPSSPRGFGDFFGYYYTSAPTSPTRASAIYRQLNGGLDDVRHVRSSSVIPFDWEEKPGTPKSSHGGDGDGDEDVDFAFEFSGQLEMGSSPLTADELFEEGKIRPLKPPPRLQQVAPPATISGGEKIQSSSPRSPKSPKSPKSPRSRIFRSPRHWGKQDDVNPFAKAMEETTRGRDRGEPLSSGGNSRGSRRAARSLSPLRGVFDFGGGDKASATTATTTTTAAAATTNTGADNNSVRWIKTGGSKKWRLKDLFLFRSASEGRATGAGGKDPLRKYTALSPSSSALLSQPPKKSSAAAVAEDPRNASFRSTDSGSVSSGVGGGSVGGSSRRGVSAHERLYTANRAVSEELRRKTMLPYRQGLFGCLGFHNPAINSLTRGLGTFSRGRS